MAIDKDISPELVYSILILAVVTSSVVVHSSMTLTKAFKYCSIWLLIALTLFSLYTFRHESRHVFARLFSELVPSYGNNADGEISFPISRDGHFFLEAEVNGASVRFLVDTGASDIILTLRDAKRLGFNMKNLNYDKIYNTANGRVFAASVLLKSIIVGPITLNNFSASINQADLKYSLLGMTFLNQLSSYEVRDDILILRP